EGLNQADHPAGLGQAHASHDGVPVDVEPGATQVEDVHHRLPFGWRRRGAPDNRSLGCVLRPKGLATVRGAQGAPGPTNTRARGTKTEPTSGPAPLSTIDPFHPAWVKLRPVGNLIAVGMPITERPPHRSERARFGHSAPTLGV